MKQRSGYIFWLAGCAAVLILACQLYWVYYNYRNARTNFIATANYSLRQSVDQYQLMQNKLPTSLEYKKPSLTFMTRTLPDQDPLALDTPSSKRRFSAEFSTVAVDEMHLPELRSLVARLLSQQRHRPLHMDTLSRLFRQELHRNHINEPFKLSISRAITEREGEVSMRVNFYKDPVLIKADLLHPGRFFLMQNWGPAAISTLLILLSAGSLFYMGRVIRRQARLDSMKTDFINNISHELKTPLSILRTSNEAMANFGAADEPASLDRYLKINAGVIDLMDLNINRLIDLGNSAVQEPNWETLDLQELIAKMIANLPTERLPEIQLEIDEASFMIITDRYMLNVIVTNLLDNAIKYSGENANILIRASKIVQGWQLQVSDNGPGIDAAYLPYIFDRFYRVPTGDIHEIKGYGIGLAHVKALTSTLNGKINVNSKPGNGTIFTIDFKC